MAQISPPELAYITDSLLAGKRTDGRALLSFREIHLSTNVVPQASGSSRVSCGGTDVLVGIKLETGDVDSEDRLGVSLEVSQSALQSLPSDPSHSLVIHANSLISHLLSHRQLVILPGSKCWHLNFHISILSSAGGANIHDVLSIAVKAALWDLRIPRTRRIEFVKPAERDVVTDGEDAGMKSLLKGRKGNADAQKSDKGAADFELIDYEADAGEPLQGREDFPLSLTLNLVPTTNQPFLDATLPESFCSPTRLICCFDKQGNVRGLRQEIPDRSASSEPNEIPFDQLDGLLDTASTISAELLKAINGRLADPACSRGGARLGAYP